ncbi:uncharacterized protein [Desmodus rotundus]|uniref:uncharacterized protein isoform X2 n=1 Tax=Desmodus rotundus TaxID=9430 RepID=UPI002380CE53|nr:uncharacterized protein LOC123480768 isoform X3 [Desmodus rotundus]XP_045059753.2 uncharacterized protein LOC123480768 isoform X3 [Desmodus rotundus]
MVLASRLMSGDEPGAAIVQTSPAPVCAARGTVGKKTLAPLHLTTMSLERDTNRPGCDPERDTSVLLMADSSLAREPDRHGEVLSMGAGLPSGPGPGTDYADAEGSPFPAGSSRLPTPGDSRALPFRATSPVFEECLDARFVTPSHWSPGRGGQRGLALM